MAKPVSHLSIIMSCLELTTKFVLCLVLCIEGCQSFNLEWNTEPKYPPAINPFTVLWKNVEYMFPNSQLSQLMRGGTYRNETVHDNKLSCWINVLQLSTVFNDNSEASHNLQYFSCTILQLQVTITSLHTHDAEFTSTLVLYMLSRWSISHKYTFW